MSLTEQTWGYGVEPEQAVEASIPAEEVAAFSEHGMGSLSAGGITSNNPAVQRLKDVLGGQFSDDDLSQMVEDIRRAVQQGIPLDKVPQLCIPPSLAAEIYEEVAAAQGTSADAIAQKYEQERQADMAAVQGAVMGGGILGMLTAMDREAVVGAGKACLDCGMTSYEEQAAVDMNLVHEQGNGLNGVGAGRQQGGTFVGM